MCYVHLLLAALKIHPTSKLQYFEDMFLVVWATHLPFKDISTDGGHYKHYKHDDMPMDVH